MKKLKLFIVFLSLLITNIFSTIYIDPTNMSHGDGTINNPYQSWHEVPWRSNETYLQKTGTIFRSDQGITLEGSDLINITFDSYGNATAANPKIVINTSTNGKVIDAEVVSNFTIKNYELTSETWPACLLLFDNDQGNHTVSNCTLHHANWGIRALNCQGNITITDCKIFNTTDDGIFLFNVNDVKIDNCNIYKVNQGWLISTYEEWLNNWGGDCIQVNTANNITISNCTLDHSDTGGKACLILSGLKSNTLIKIFDNKLKGQINKTQDHNSVNGIYLTGQQSDVQILNNTIETNNIGLLSQVNFVAKDNIFIDNEQSVSIYPNISATLTNNIFNTVYTPVIFNSYETYTIILGNTFIVPEGTNNLLTGNIIPIDQLNTINYFNESIDTTIIIEEPPDSTSVIKSYSFTIYGELYEKQKVGKLDRYGLLNTNYVLTYNPNDLFYLTPRTGILKINKPNDINEGIHTLVAVLNEEQYFYINIIVNSKYTIITLPADKKEYYLKLLIE